jgi:hypothetical protein
MAWIDLWLFASFQKRAASADTTRSIMTCAIECSRADRLVVPDATAKIARWRRGLLLSSNWSETMAVRKTFIVDVDQEERVAVSRIRGERPIVLEIHRLKNDPAVAFIELTPQMATDVRDAIDAVLKENA